MVKIIALGTEDGLILLHDVEVCIWMMIKTIGVYCIFISTFVCAS
jgi:hypothetical protein